MSMSQVLHEIHLYQKKKKKTFVYLKFKFNWALSFTWQPNQAEVPKSTSRTLWKACNLWSVLEESVSLNLSDNDQKCNLTEPSFSRGPILC